MVTPDAQDSDDSDDDPDVNLCDQDTSIPSSLPSSQPSSRYPTHNRRRCDRYGQNVYDS